MLFCLVLSLDVVGIHTFLDGAVPRLVCVLEVQITVEFIHHFSLDVLDLVGRYLFACSCRQASEYGGLSQVVWVLLN